MSEKQNRANAIPLNTIDAASCWLTFQAMLEVTRPDEEGAWRHYSSSRKIAWKTGTSVGFRDGWAVGATPGYAVGIWVGNADGEGRAGLIGVDTAAPILFELFGLLDDSGWFECPEADLYEIKVCSHSGYRAGQFCTTTKETWVTGAGLRSPGCPYCRIVHCDSTMKWRVHADCAPFNSISQISWFVLPPGIEWFYKKKHADYLPLPPYRGDCLSSIGSRDDHRIDLIYPQNNSTIYIPIELDGRRGRTVVEAVHRDNDTTIYWHLDENYLGATHEIHQMAIAPQPGKHVLTLVDDNGERLQHVFAVLSKEP